MAISHRATNRGVDTLFGANKRLTGISFSLPVFHH